MKICIIGAGVAGLSCALTLEKYGIIPDVIEQYERIGGRTPFINCYLQLYGRPIHDRPRYLASHYGITFQPVSPMNKLIMLSPNNIAVAKGRLGYIYSRGPSVDSIENQIYAQLQKTKIKFDTLADFKELSEGYDRVVVATGSPYIAKELGLWTDLFRSWTRGAVMQGEFDPTAWITWWNKSYANDGYAYLGPFDGKTASLVFIASGIREDEVESRWRMFLDVEKLNYKELDSFLLEHIAGHCYPKETGNLMFIGNSAGLMDSMLGFGDYNAIVSGVLAAEAIYEGSSYQKKVAILKKKLKQAYLYRLAFNRFTNDTYDKLFNIMKTQPISKMIYDTNLDVIGLIGRLLELAKGNPSVFSHF